MFIWEPAHIIELMRRLLFSWREGKLSALVSCVRLFILCLESVVIIFLRLRLSGHSYDTVELFDCANLILSFNDMIKMEF